MPANWNGRLREALVHPGFSFVEVIAPCSTAYARWNPEGRGLDPEKLGRRGLETMKYYQKVGRTAHETHPKDAGVKVNEKGEITEIVEGDFLVEANPSLKDALDGRIEQARESLASCERNPGQQAAIAGKERAPSPHRSAAWRLWRTGDHQRRPDRWSGGCHL